MAYLLVHAGDASEAQNYGMALVWISPHQVCVSTMEEAVGDTVHLHLQWTQLAVCSCTAIRGLQPYTPPQGQTFRCLAQGKVEESPYGQISQLEVCQLLSTGP